MKEKILKMLLGIFSILFLFYPTSYGIGDIKIVILFYVILAGILYCVVNRKRNFFKKEKNYIWIIVFCALITRIGIVLLLHSDITQVSDFKNALEASKTLDFSDSFYRIFNHWTFYPVIVHFVYKLFGQSQLVALLFNSIILVVNSVLVYWIGSLLLNNKKRGFCASMLYIFWPANIFYTLIFTPEHVGMMLLLLSLYLFVKMEQSASNKIYIILIGFLLGFSVFFKNFAPIFIIAFLIYYVLNLLKEKNLKKYIFQKSCILLGIIVSFLITKNVLFLSLDHIVGNPVIRNVTPCYLNVGFRGFGVYDYDNYEMYYSSLKKNNYDYKKTNKEILENLWNHLKNQNSEARQRSFFENKAKILFGNDSYRMIWLSLSFQEGGHEKIVNIIDGTITTWNNIYFMIVVTLMGLGLFYMYHKKDLLLFLIYLIIHGCFLMLILVEAQNRYMYSIQPLFCILAITGVISLKYFLMSIISEKQIVEKLK